jgi:Flp pilus assembly CpaE family ATPase
MVLVDIGNSFFPDVDKVLNLSNEIVVAVEPHPITVLRTKALIDELHEKGFGKSRAISVVLVNRIRSDVQMSWTQVQESLGQQVSYVISPYPEMAYQAATRAMPIIQLQPEGLISQQYGNVAEFLSHLVHKQTN